MFQPHVLVVPVGATVDFQNSDWCSTIVLAVDQWQQEAWPQSRNLAQRGEAFVSVRPTRSDLAALQCASRNVRISLVSPTPYFAETDERETSRSAMFRMASTTWSRGTKAAKQQTKPVDVVRQRQSRVRFRQMTHEANIHNY